MNSLEELIRAARPVGGRPAAVADPKSGISDAELFQRAADLADTLTAQASSRGPVVALELPLSVDAVVALLAGIVADVTICFLDPATPAERRAELVATLRPDLLVDDVGVHPVAGRGVERTPEPTAGYVAVTSGSTGGGPKGVLCPWSTIAAFAPFGAAALDLDGDAVLGELSHPAYDMAMTNLLVALASGAALRVSGTLGDRVRPLRFAERVGATHVRLAPRFCDLAAAERRPHVPAALRVWASGGDRLFAVHAEQLFRLGVPTVVNTYGTSEASGFASAARFVAGDTLATVHGSVTIGRGAVGPWTTQLLQEAGSSGKLAITSPYRPTGYLVGEPAGEYPRWKGTDTVVTGDDGTRLDEDLYCLGRAGRRVKRNARFVDLDAVDAAIRTELGVSAFTVSSEDGTLTSLIESADEAVGALRTQLRTALTPDLLPERLIAVRNLPRLGNGKIDHAAARARTEQATASGTE